ncbi:Transcription initiation factor TFIID subunit 12 [Echinococcus granulosus]|uniref:Transcription initiation factor TFIID subunit 12 n=1 Tax=Echinococcus granulosus TaxID=6210 RepID=A0A068W7R6_ECHGR|nr:Transcription initiation factor TFIID subunit 12 [Echinococcus granulosus]CDS15408.1 Transcription initiation factor TFIID subunit [Echinococcus granulosus]
MNGSNEQISEQSLQQSIAIPLATVGPAPDLGGVISVSSAPAVWTQQQTTAVVSTPRPTVFVSSQAPTTVNSGSPIVFTPAVTSINGPIVVAPASAVSTDVQSSPQTNGVVSVSESTPKAISLPETTSSLPTSTPSASQSATSNTTSTDSSQQKQKTVFNTKSLLELVKETDPYLQLDDEAEEALTILSEEFIEKVAKRSIKMANHRGSPTVEAKDVKFCLDHDWNLFIPGFPTVEKNFKRPFILQAHKQRLALIKKQIKRS